jgi:5-methylcytosine-specific restriction endonuclease McrA
MAIMAACVSCFQPYERWTRNNRGRCRACLRLYEREKRQRRGTTTQRGLGAEHQRLAKQVLSEEQACWLCGGLARPNDPLEVDHVIPRSAGGKTERSNLRAAHASCNRSRGGRGRGRLEADDGLTRRSGFREKQSLEILGPQSEIETEGPLVG